MRNASSEGAAPANPASALCTPGQPQPSIASEFSGLARLAATVCEAPFAAIELNGYGETWCSSTGALPRPVLPQRCRTTHHHRTRRSRMDCPAPRARRGGNSSHPQDEVPPRRDSGGGGRKRMTLIRTFAARRRVPRFGENRFMVAFRPVDPRAAHPERRSR